MLTDDHCDQFSDLPGPDQSHEPGQAEPVSAGPSQAIGDGPAMALAWLRVAKSRGFWDTTLPLCSVLWNWIFVIFN